MTVFLSILFDLLFCLNYHIPDILQYADPVSDLLDKHHSLSLGGSSENTVSITEATMWKWEVWGSRDVWGQKRCEVKRVGVIPFEITIAVVIMLWIIQGCITFYSDKLNLFEFFIAQASNYNRVNVFFLKKTLWMLTALIGPVIWQVILFMIVVLM